MSRYWNALAARFAGLTRRERGIVMVALFLGVVLIGDALWLSPSLARHTQLKRQIAEKRDEIARMNTEVTTLRARVESNQAGNRTTIESLRRELDTTSTQLAGFERQLVPAQKMPEFLQGLLPAGSGLEVVSLKTLAPEPLLARKAPENAVPTGAAAPLANLYKHGVELRVAGTYAALHEYLGALERAPQKVLWGRLELKVVGYPRSEMTLILYTLSLDPSWLIV